MPNGSLQLEWANVQNVVDKTSSLLQNEVFKRFSDDSDSWLLSLGFYDHQTWLSPSLDYERNFTGVYIRRLSRTPDLEILRHKAKGFDERR